MSELFSSSPAKTQVDRPSQADGSLSDISAPTLRDSSYLSRLALGEVAPIIIVSGQSSAGKSRIIEMLSEAGVVPTTRLMPRQRREGDVAGDLAWTEVNIPELGAACDEERIAFSDHKYKGYYAFPVAALTRLITNDTPAAVIIGRCIEIPAMVEACANILPGAPVIPLRLDVPLQVLESRLGSRAEAHPGEGQERLSLLERMNRDDRPQITSLRDLYGLRSVFNISEAECNGLGYSLTQLQPLNSELLRTVMNEFISEAKSRSRQLGLDLLTPRSISYDGAYIPNSLVDVLENQLLPTMQSKGIECVLKGGLAVAVYLEERNRTCRPVSPDIDFTFRQTAGAEQVVAELLSSLSGSPQEFGDAWSKKVYHVRGINTSVESAGFKQRVELDAISLTRVQPGNHGFSLSFGFDALDNFHRRTAILPNGLKVGIAPPEHIILEKLAAGRGAELGKFDLYDAAGLMTSLPLHMPTFRKLIDSQRFERTNEQPLLAQFGDRSEVSLKEIGRTLEIKSTALLVALKELERPFELKEREHSPKEERVLGLDELKKLVLLDRINNALERIITDLDKPVDIGESTTSISMSYGGEKVTNAVRQLQKFIQYYVKFELGVCDIFVRRPSGSSTEREQFFAHLSNQRQSLTVDYE